MLCRIAFGLCLYVKHINFKFNSGPILGPKISYHVYKATPKYEKL